MQSRLQQLGAALRALSEPAPGEGPAQAVVRAAAGLFPDADVRVLAAGAPAAALSHGRCLALALELRGRPLGTLELSRSERQAAFTEEEQQLAEAFAAGAALGLERRSDAHRFLDAIVENIPHMVFVKEAERLAFALFNRAGEQLLGIPREQLLGKTDYDLFPEEEADFFQAKDRETLDDKVLVDIPEEPIETAGGTRWLHTKKVPILGEAGEPLYLLGISEDVTERKAADAALRSARDEALTAMRELEAFSYSVAHDLRAPLRSIDGFSQLLLEDCGDALNDEGKRYLKIVRDSAQRMGQLIDALLLLSRVTRSELRRDRIDLSALAQQTVAALQRLRPERDVRFAIQPGLSADGDPRLLGLVLDNLLGNAWKFTSKRSQARIELGALEDQTPLVYFVRDNGAGFDMSGHDKLFGAFTRLHSPHEFEGNGIGLATVARIVTRHGGRIWAEGKVDEGATFFFTLGPP